MDIHLHKNITYLRNMRGWDQGQLAERLDVKRNSVSNYENNVSRPDYETLIKLSRIFDISLDALITKDLSVKEYDLALMKAQEGETAYGKSLIDRIRDLEKRVKKLEDK